MNFDILNLLIKVWFNDEVIFVKPKPRNLICNEYIFHNNILFNHCNNDKMLGFLIDFFDEWDYSNDYFVLKTVFSVYTVLSISEFINVADNFFEYTDNNLFANTKDYLISNIFHMVLNNVFPSVNSICHDLDGNKFKYSDYGLHRNQYVHIISVIKNFINKHGPCKKNQSVPRRLVKLKLLKFYDVKQKLLFGEKENLFFICMKRNRDLYNYQNKVMNVGRVLFHEQTKLIIEENNKKEENVEFILSDKKVDRLTKKMLKKCAYEPRFKDFNIDFPIPFWSKKETFNLCYHNDNKVLDYLNALAKNYKYPVTRIRNYKDKTEDYQNLLTHKINVINERKKKIKDDKHKKNLQKKLKRLSKKQEKNQLHTY